MSAASLNRYSRALLERTNRETRRGRESFRAQFTYQPVVFEAFQLAGTQPRAIKLFKKKKKKKGEEKMHAIEHNKYNILATRKEQQRTLNGRVPLCPFFFDGTR